MQKAPNISGLRNSGEAYRQFRPTGFMTGAHEIMIGLLNHRLVGAVIALMGSAGIAGTFIIFWPR
jgi:hypothetical protein